MVPRLRVVLVVGVIGSQSAQVSLADVQALHLILQDDTGMEQPILDDIVTGGLLLIGEWYLRQIVGTVVRIESGAINGGNNAIANSFSGLIGCCYTVVSRIARRHAHHGLVTAAPVVNILSAAPFALEGSLTLTHSRGVIEVPCATCLLGTS